MRRVTENIVVRLIPDGDEPQYYEALDALVAENKTDYVPWKKYAAADGTPKEEFFWNYRDKKERVLIAFDTRTNKVCGFATVDTPSERDDIPAESPFTYYSLMLVDEEYRRNGIATTFYEYVLDDLLPKWDAPNPVVLGTWEENREQIDLLDRFGFERFAVKSNHRANGEDTHYYRTTY